MQEGQIMDPSQMIVVGQTVHLSPEAWEETIQDPTAVIIDGHSCCESDLELLLWHNLHGCGKLL